MKNRDINIDLDEWVELENRHLNKQVATCQVNGNSLLKTKPVQHCGRRRMTQLLTVYSILIILFTLFSVLICDQVGKRRGQPLRNAVNLQVFSDAASGSAILLSSVSIQPERDQ